MNLKNKSKWQSVWKNWLKFILLQFEWVPNISEKLI